ncbi:hypothetical protein ACE14D_24435, partial [Streptomyces sp. Act-28]
MLGAWASRGSGTASGAGRAGAGARAPWRRNCAPRCAGAWARVDGGGGGAPRPPPPPPPRRGPPRAPDGARYEFTHDTDLRLVEVRDPRGLTWTYDYD